MSRLDLDEADFLFRCAALPDDTLRVYRFSGREALNQLLEFKIELVSANANLDLWAPIGQPACLMLRGRHPGGERYTRYVHGVIERATQIQAGARYSVYEVTLGSPLSKLANGQDCRIFQKLSAPEVIYKVLARAGYPMSAVQTLLHSTYGERDYCVQYQESSLRFIQRLCEQEGICTFFDHHEDGASWILGDGAHAFDTLRNAAELRHHDEPHLFEEGLWELREQSWLRPGKAILQDFRFQQPSLEMEAVAEANTYSDYSMYYFPGDYVDPALGRRQARLRLEEQQCEKHRFCGRSNVRALLPGYRFTLDGHRRWGCNQEYLIVAVRHSGVQPQALPQAPPYERQARSPLASAPALLDERLCYENQLECIPATVQFRPARLTPRPQIVGVQTAVVVGPPGEEVHCDEHGRVKVQFHWDRTGGWNDASSCWIRVSQPFSGLGYGALFLPRVAHEVIVQFLHGDPDRPLIIGRVHNGDNPPPYELPAAKSISTIRTSSIPGGEGWNELRFDDQHGKEQLHLRAQRDYSLLVGHNACIHVAADQRCRVGRDHSLTVQGSLSTVVEDGQHKTEVAGGNSELWVLAGSHITKAEGPVTIESGTGTLNLRAGGNWSGESQQQASLQAPEITISAGKKLTLSVGESSIELTEEGINISGPKITSEALGKHVISGALVAIN